MRMKHLRRVVPFFLVFVAAQTGRAQDPTQATQTPAALRFNIRGVVRLADNEKRVESIRVDLRLGDGQLVQTVYTRSNGDFEFRGLRPGPYYVVVQAEGYEPVREQVEIYNSSREGVLIYLQKPIMLFMRQNDPAVSARELALPSKARDAWKRGLKKMNEKDGAEASLKEFEKVQTLTPDFFEASCLSGSVLVKLAREAEAEGMFRKCLEVSGNQSAEGYVGLAGVLNMRQGFAEAEGAARTGLKISEKMWEGHYELARALYGQNKLDAALESAKEVQKRNPGFAPGYLVTANIQMKRKDYGSVVAALNEYLKLDPKGDMSEQVRQTRDKYSKAMKDAKGPGA